MKSSNRLPLSLALLVLLIVPAGLLLMRPPDSGKSGLDGDSGEQVVSGSPAEKSETATDGAGEGADCLLGRKCPTLRVILPS
jgi:hypothetical protein